MNSGLLSVELTSKCLNKCIYCFANKDSICIKEFSFNDVVLFVKDGFNAGFRNLHLTGGEPFLWSRLVDLIALVLSIGYEHIFINTTAQYIPQKVLQRLIDYRDSVDFSVTLLGNRDNHDYWRGPGTWDAAFNGTILLLENYFNVKIFNVISKLNLNTLAIDTEQIFNNLAVEGISFIQLIRVPGDTYNLSKYLLTPSDFIRLVESTSLLKLGGYKVDIMENPLSNVVADVTGRKWLDKNNSLLRNGKILLMSDGSVEIAHSSRYLSQMYQPGMIDQILKSEKYASLLEDINNVCDKCNYKKICQENGMLLPSEAYRSYNKELFCKLVLDQLFDDSL